MPLTQPDIVGYRQLTDADAEFINTIKQHGRDLGDLVERLHSEPGVDARWVSIGATDLQKGLMALTRAVAKPTTF